MGEYDSNNYEDVSNYLNFIDDSGDEDDAMTTPTPNNHPDDKEMATPLSPPASAGDEGIEEEDQDDDDLYGDPNRPLWKERRDSCISASLDSPVNPKWLYSSDQPRRNSMVNSDFQHHPSPPTSDDSKTPNERRTALETIQERNEQLVKTGTSAKTSKSFPLLPDLLSLKQAEDEDEKILASEEGKKLNPKERRQLRNKVSARNFRVRRKEYIGHLEQLVESQGQEIENLRQSLSAVQLENTTLRQESRFLRSIALNQPSPQSAQDSVMNISHPNKDINPNTLEWPLAYDGMSSPTQSPNNKFSDRPMFGNGHIHAYGVRVPEVQFDKPHLSNSANALAPPLPSQSNQQYPPNSPRSAQEGPKTPTGQSSFPQGTDNLGYPHMLQAVSYLYDYIVKASNPAMLPPPPPPQQPQLPPVSGYPMQQTPYHPPPQPWDAKAIGAPVLGFSPHYNGSWGWGGPPGPAA